ncbi:dapL [Scenedesmus sp. PABB004]|nr:dapL [Scenedesmus sp. PABB004]
MPKLRSARTPQSDAFLTMDRAKTAAARAGKAIVDLSVGSSDLPPPQEALDALQASLSDPAAHKYCLKSGTMPLLEAACDWYARTYGVRLDPATQALSLVGSQEGLAHLLLAVTDPGDTLLLTDVAYPSYFGAAKVAGLRTALVPLDPATRLADLSAVSPGDAAAATALLLNVPCNPTGAVADEAWWARVLAFAEKHDLLLIHDNPYVHQVFDAPAAVSPLALPGASARVVELFSFAKSWQLGGFRLGFALGCAPALAALEAVKAPIDFNQYLGIQRMGVACLRLPPSVTRDYAAVWERRAAALVDALAAHGWAQPAPRACMYVWARLPDGVAGGDDVAFCEQLVAATGVALAPGRGFGPGGAGHVRFALVRPEGELRAAAAAVPGCLQALPGSFLQQLVTSVPPHLKARLRAVSRKMLRIVDGAHGLRLTAGAAASGGDRGGSGGAGSLPVALRLARPHVAALDLSALASDAPSQQLAAIAALGLPALAELTLGHSQLGLLATVAAFAPRLACLRLVSTSRAPLSDDERAGALNLLAAQLPALGGVRRLELDAQWHRLLAQEPQLAAAVGSLTALRALVMQGDPERPDARWASLSEPIFLAAVAPLTRLTRLAMGTVLADKLSPAAAVAGLAPSLRDLRCFGYDNIWRHGWALEWAAHCSGLTALEVTACDAAPGCFEAIAGLRGLRSLSLQYDVGSAVSSAWLAPLAACAGLTALRLGALVLQPGHAGPGGRSAAVDAEAAALLAARAERLALAPGGAEEGPAGGAAPAPAPPPGAALPALGALRRLHAGLVCKAPIASLSPNLTELIDSGVNLYELGVAFQESEAATARDAFTPPPPRLAALELGDLAALDGHAGWPGLAALPGLRELRLEMRLGAPGGLAAAASLGGGGLARLPGLTKLVLMISRDAAELGDTYNSEEDVLLWRRQADLRVVELRGSRLLGGFMVQPPLLSQLARQLPALECVELTRCHDLSALELAALVASRAVPRVVVRDCGGVRDRDCAVMQTCARGAVVVECAS